MAEKGPENIPAKTLLATAYELYTDKDYVQLHGFTEIRTLLQMADIQLRLSDG